MATEEGSVPTGSGQIAKISKDKEIVDCLSQLHDSFVKLTLKGKKV